MNSPEDLRPLHRGDLDPVADAIGKAGLVHAPSFTEQARRRNRLSRTTRTAAAGRRRPFPLSRTPQATGPPTRVSSLPSL